MDFRLIIMITEKYRYLIQRIDEIIDFFNGASYFSTLDATSGYYQVKMEDKSGVMTAFSWGRAL
ncbi:putative LTR transposable element [Pseudoloma neurophilia]|uniref:Putative LTR transposable element n=1 Tax=Pseudoloma neurophilia TaxID=146866 RepID=A0A0R0LRP1_9MICR|nr:putative LTR transposable element [Pseudoloma neurophilia]